MKLKEVCAARNVRQGVLLFCCWLINARGVSKKKEDRSSSVIQKKRALSHRKYQEKTKKMRNEGGEMYPLW